MRWDAWRGSVRQQWMRRKQLLRMSERDYIKAKVRTHKHSDGALAVFPQTRRCAPDTGVTARGPPSPILYGHVARY